MKYHPAEAFLIATREERARRMADMPPMVSVLPVLRIIEDLHVLALRALEALPASAGYKEMDREGLRTLRNTGDREQLVEKVVAYMGKNDEHAYTS
jgi:hypothetical protein